SVRVSGISSSQKKAMLDYFEQIDSLFREGKIGYDKKHFNCADLVKNSLIKAGLNIPSSQKEKGPTFPLDVLTNSKNYFESSPTYKSEIVLYSKANGSENSFKQNTFPISPNQFQRTIKTLTSSNYVDEFERSVGKRIAIGSSDPKTYFENLNGVSELETQKEVERQEEFLEKSLLSFEKYETQLDQLDKYSSEFKFKSDDIAKDLKIISKEYTVEELNHVIKNEISEKTFPEVDKRKRAEALFIGFKQWEKLQKTYQENMDSFIKTEMNYLIVGTYTTLTVLWDDLVLKYPKIPRKELNELLSKAQLNYKLYQQSIEQYGKPLDGPTRTTAYRAFFDNAKEFIDLYQLATHNQILAKDQIKKIDSKAKRLFSTIKGIVLMTPEMVKVLFKSFLPTRYTDSSVALSKSIDSLFLKFAKAFGISASLENKEVLDKLIKEATPGSKKINIITPNHSHPIHDAILMSSLNLPNYLLVMATDQILAGSLADKVDKNDHIITVGRGSDTPINKILAQLEKGEVNNIVIYPEGSVSVGIYETRPLREKFSHGL
ncbi:MAG: hypothetical protein L6Q37_17380, partial [Bdellovibrionaceae bacterium]|nr:hypothetical protein [Pseudobdellovibrionaceae bacterium]